MGEIVLGFVGIGVVVDGVLYGLVGCVLVD